MSYCFNVSQNTKPLEYTLEAFGFCVALSGSEMFAIADGKYAQAALLCSLSGVYGKVFYIIFETALGHCKLCKPKTSTRVPQHFMQSIGKVAKYVVIGFLPAWGTTKAAYQSLKPGTAALYLAGAITPFAVMSGIVSIFHEFQNRCSISTAGRNKTTMNENHLPDLPNPESVINNNSDLDSAVQEDKVSHDEISASGI